MLHSNKLPCVKKAVQDGKNHPYHSNTRIMNVCTSVSFEAQTHSASCGIGPLTSCPIRLPDPPESSMASRRGPSQAKEDEHIIRERLAKQRARLQAVAVRNRERIAKEKREREEAAQVAGPAKAARAGARTPTPPPPHKAVPKRGGTAISGSHSDAPEESNC